MKEVLGDIIERFRFFFNDYFNSWYCPTKLVQKIVVHLRSKMYERGSYMVECGENISNLIFLYSGNARLFG